MNLVLIRGGWPPVAVRPEDRPAYVRSLAAAQGGDGSGAYDRLMAARLEATLDDYLAVLEAEAPSP